MYISGLIPWNFAELAEAELTQNELCSCIRDLLKKKMSHITNSWVKVQNFKNPELSKFNLKTCLCLQSVNNFKI